MFVETKFWDDLGRLNNTVALDTLATLKDEDKLIFIRVGSCVKVKHDNMCERAFLVHKCIKQKDPDVSAACELNVCYVTFLMKLNFSSITF